VVPIAIALLSGSYSVIAHINSQWYDLAGRSLQSIPFMLGGAYLAKVKATKLFGVSAGVALMTTGFALQVLESKLLYDGYSIPYESHQFLVGTSVFALGVFILAFNLNTKDIGLNKLGKDFSLFIYLYHPAIISLLIHLHYSLALSGWGLLTAVVPVFFIALIAGYLLKRFIPSVFQILNGMIPGN
jgi:hypothetical protein